MRIALMVGGLVALALAACESGPPTPAEVAGTYRADLPATSGAAARSVLLRLDPSHAAEMSVRGESGAEPLVEVGTWSVAPDGEVRVVLARDGFGPVTSDLNFRWARATLTAIAFDTLRWGPQGFSLARE